VKLRRLEAYVESGQPARLLAGALGAVERAERAAVVVRERGRDRDRAPGAAGAGCQAVAGTSPKERPQPELPSYRIQDSPDAGWNNVGIGDDL
jgi:hypothetical protein